MTKSYRKSYATELQNAIPQEIIEFNNANHLWQYGYNKEYDIVVISKNGTIGQIFNVNDLKIAIPKQPPKEEIRGYQRRPEHQVWYRYNVPKDLANFQAIYNQKKDLKPSEEQQIINELAKTHKHFITNDFQKINTGDWIMIDGEPIYITGGHYFLLQHWYLAQKRIYPKFRIIQRDFYYFIQACYADPRSYGALLLKNRQIFFSTVAGAEIFRTAAFNPNCFSPILSLKESNAIKFLRNNIGNNIKYLPKHLLPNFQKNKLSIHFKGLESFIEAYALTLEGYDGERVQWLAVIDELGKYFPLDVNDIWDAYCKRAHEHGTGQPQSKVLAGSTPGQYDRGGENYKILYYKSKLNTRDKTTGFTKSGMYAIYIPSDFGISRFYDQYGHIIYHDPIQPVTNELGEKVTFGSKTYLDSEEAKCTTTKDLINQKINFSRTEEEAFIQRNELEMFNRGNLENYKQFILQNRIEIVKKQHIHTFDLLWKDGVQDSEAILSPNPNGKFVASWIPPKQLRNQYTTKGNVKYPKNKHIGAIGIDPYDARGAARGGSKVAAVGTSNRNFNIPDLPEACAFLLYNHRPETVDEYCEDMILLLRFYSVPALIENNKKVLLRKLAERNMRGFSLNRTDKKWEELSPDEKAFGGMPSSANITSGGTISRQENTLETWIANDLNQHPTLQNNKCLILEIIEDVLKYNQKNRTKRDISIALAFSLLANFDHPIVKNNRKTKKINFRHFQSAISN